MISGEHRKHSHLTKPSFGIFSRNEWAITGAANVLTEKLVDTIINQLSPLYKCAYADVLQPGMRTNSPVRLAAGAVAEYINTGYFHQFTYKTPVSKFAYRQLLGEADLVLVNGNNLEASAQVIIIDQHTQSLLKEKLPMLTNVQMILLAHHEIEIFDFVKEAIPAWQQLPVYYMDDTTRITGFFVEQMKRAQPVINGLVLAGGKSMRMGADKALMKWHGKEQRYYIADLLGAFTKDVFISCRIDQQEEIDSSYKTIEDSFTGLGPYGAILSAFRTQPDAAWLVVACDLPLLEAATLQYLVEQRKPSAMATAFENPDDHFPEPLLAIWEPKSYPVLLSLLSQGYTCPKKALQGNDAFLLVAPRPDALLNVNTPEDKLLASKMLQDGLS
ncbi:MAG: NTP transferase domain-containing protein [Chitinophagaceae bacterium]